MNERIKQLAEQAGLELGTVLKDYTTPVKSITIEQRKFAELIVQECIDTMYKRGEAYAHPSAGFYQAKTFSEAITEHFGVDE